MMRSGRIRRALITRSRMWMAPCAFDVGRTGFHARHVRLAQPQFGRVFDGDDALVFRNVSRQHVEQRGFAGAGAAADQNVQPRFDAGLQQLQHAFGHGQLLDQILALELIAAETADREQRAVHRDRRNGRIDARAIGQAGVDERRRLIHAPAHARHHFLDNAQQVRVILELHRACGTVCRRARCRPASAWSPECPRWSGPAAAARAGPGRRPRPGSPR